MPGFALLRTLTTGEKHFVRAMIENTRHVAGYGSGPYSVGPFGESYLLIDYGAEKPDRWKTAEQLLDSAVQFWRDFFATHRPERISSCGIPSVNRSPQRQEAD